MVKLRLYFGGTLAREAKYLDQPLQLLWELETNGWGCELINTDEWTEEQFRRLYREAMASAILNGQGIRRAFGSRADGRSGFAKYTPALLVFDDSDCPIAVYPHMQGGKKVEIIEYLTDLLRGRDGPLSQ